MSDNAYKKNLASIISELQKANGWLSRSFEKCRTVDINGKMSDEQFDDLEALASRFVRVSDLLIQRVFRSLDSVEFENTGSIIDAVNRSEKRGLIKSVDDLREIRELRNRISHEYVSDQLFTLLEKIRSLTPLLQNIIKNTLDYCERFEK